MLPPARPPAPRLPASPRLALKQPFIPESQRSLRCRHSQGIRLPLVHPHSTAGSNTHFLRLCRAQPCEGDTDGWTGSRPAAQGCPGRWECAPLSFLQKAGVCAHGAVGVWGTEEERITPLGGMEVGQTQKVSREDPEDLVFTSPFHSCVTTSQSLHLSEPLSSCRKGQTYNRPPLSAGICSPAPRGEYQTLSILFFPIPTHL